MRSLLVPALLCLSCYSPEIPSGKFVCTQDEDCPEAFLCRPMGNKGSRCVSSAPPAASPCTGEAVMLSATVWGCRGAFAMGAASGLCTKPGWHPCEAKDASKLGLGAACDSAMGFFASRVPIEHVNDAGGGKAYDVDCDIGSSVDMPYGLLGCGTEDGARHVGNKSGNCPGLTTALACGMASRWSCAAEGLDRTAYDGKGGGGVLCCTD